MKHVNVHAVHELDQFSRKCLPKDVSASGGTTPWRAFQPEPEAGDLPFPTTRRGWVAGATEHEPSGAPSRHTPGGRLSAVGGESDAAGAGDELRGRDLAVVDGVDDDRVGDQWAKLLSGRMPLWPPPSPRTKRPRRSRRTDSTAAGRAPRAAAVGRRVTARRRWSRSA